MQSLRIALVSAASTAAVALTAAAAPLAVAQPANTVPLAFDCQAKPPVGSAQKFAMEAVVDATAPATATKGQQVTGEISVRPIKVPAEQSGYKVEHVKNMVISAQVPAGTEFVSATLSGGKGFGSAKPTVSTGTDKAGKPVVLVKIAGPIAGGATIELPKVALVLKVTASSGTVEGRLSGSSYQDPTMTFTGRAKAGLFGVDVPAACFPKPNPVLTSTRITG